MPASSPQDLPVQTSMGDYQAKGQEWGDMMVACETIGGGMVGMDAAPMFRGLPDDRCQAHHWGYLIKGKVAYRYADHEEIVEAGQVYYAPPGHIPHVLEASEGIEFTRKDELARTVEVVQRNVAELGVG